MYAETKSVTVREVIVRLTVEAGYAYGTPEPQSHVSLYGVLRPILQIPVPAQPEPLIENPSGTASWRREDELAEWVVQLQSLPHVD